MLTALAIVGLLAAVPPAPARWVTDETGQLAVDERDALNQQLEAFEKATGHQVVVWVGRTTGGEPIEDWAVRTFEAWKVGRARLDDGAALFVMLDDRVARIEVGYGLEERLTDAQSSRILREVLIPKMQAGDATGGVTGAARAMMSALGGAPESAPADAQPSRAQLYFFAVVAALLVVLFIVNPRAAFMLLMLLSSRRRGGRVGGFHGGGGRSGGGGATGRW